MIWQRLKKKGILGLNARNLLYIKANNERKYYPNVDNKLATKTLALEMNIGVPELFQVIRYPSQIKKIDKLPSSFVVKPNRGSGGEGILVVKETTAKFYVLSSGNALTKKELIYHIRNILAGVYSLGSSPDTVIIEDLVVQHSYFEKFSFRGVPDVRTIIYKGHPAMAMLRLPTRESGGKANLHQGAVGVGLSLDSGEFMGAVSKDKLITEHPDTGADLSEIKVPNWEEFISFSIKAAEISKLGYVGVDLVLDNEKGPMLLELNARPGLSIQIANNMGLQGNLDEIDLKTKGL